MPDAADVKCTNCSFVISYLFWPLWAFTATPDKMISGMTTNGSQANKALKHWGTCFNRSAQQENPTWNIWVITSTCVPPQISPTNHKDPNLLSTIQRSGVTIRVMDLWHNATHLLIKNDSVLHKYHLLMIVSAGESVHHPVYCYWAPTLCNIIHSHSKRVVAALKPLILPCQCFLVLKASLKCHLAINWDI